MEKFKKKKKTTSKIVTVGVYIVVGIFVVASIAFCVYCAYKYYTYPKMKSVHCYANNEVEKLSVYYTIIDGKISKKVEQFIYNSSSLEGQEVLSNFDDSITHKYRGYAQKLWYNNNEIMTIKVYSFEDISKQDFKELVGEEDKDKYLNVSKETIQRYYDNDGFTCEWGD